MKTNLYVLPYAGGSSTLYMKWARYLNKDIELIPIELPGRGKRINELLLVNFDEMLQDITHSISEQISSDGDSRYAIFGYSMGSLLGYELYYQIEKKKLPLPKHMFFSAMEAPHLLKNELIHTLSNEQLCNKIATLGGTTQQFFESKELLEFFLPIIRADFSVIDSYLFIPKAKKINCDISILYSQDDVETKVENVQEWKDYSNKECSFHSFSDGHFFINKYPIEIMQIINRTLL